MNGVLRGLLVLSLTVATFAGTVGSTAPAQATFGDSAGVSTSISTATVAAPTNVVGSLTCGRTSSTMSVTWTRSASARISGQQVKVYFSDGFVQTVELSATATGWTASIDTFYVTTYSIRYSVTARTDYGWSTESPLTGSFQC